MKIGFVYKIINKKKDSYGTFLVKKQKYRQAIEKFQLCLEFHSSTGVAPSQEEFGIYRQIQRCHLLLGIISFTLNIDNIYFILIII